MLDPPRAYGVPSLRSIVYPLAGSPSHPLSGLPSTSLSYFLFSSNLHAFSQPPPPPPPPSNPVGRLRTLETISLVVSLTHHSGLRCSIRYSAIDNDPRWHSDFPRRTIQQSVAPSGWRRHLAHRPALRWSSLRQRSARRTYRTGVHSVWHSASIQLRHACSSASTC